MRQLRFYTVGRGVGERQPTHQSKHQTPALALDIQGLVDADDERPEGAPAAEELWKRLGAEMREARERSGWTAADLARKIPCHPSTLSNIERGRDHPSREIVEAYDEKFSPRGEETRLQALRAEAAEAEEREKRAKRAAKSGGPVATPDRGTSEQGPPRVEEPAVEEDPAGDAVGPTAAPPAVREKTASDGRRGRFAEADPRPSAGHRGRGRMLLLLVVLAVVAGVGGYALFREPPTRPAASRSAMVGEKALQQRFVVSLNRMLHRLADPGVEARRQLVKAKTGLKQAAAARKIASAYRATAGEVARLSAAPAQRAPARAISANLKRAGRAYADLAAAAKAQNVKRYDAARRAVDAEEAALRRQLLRSGLAMR